MRYVLTIVMLLSFCCILASCGSSPKKSGPGVSPTSSTGSSETNGSPSKTNVATAPSEEFALTGVSPESLAPHQDVFAGGSGGNPVLRYHTDDGRPGERDLSFVGKFPSANPSDYTVNVEGRESHEIDRSLNVVSVTSDKITIHFPSTAGKDGLFGKMVIHVKYKNKTRSMMVFIP